MAATKVFISYSHKDNAFATRLRTDLQAAGLGIWIDHEALSPGTGNWDKAIRQGIENSFAVLYVASENAYESDFCQGELTVARLYKRPIYPIFADGTDFARCIPIDLIKVQNVDMRGDNYPAGLPRLLQALGIAQTGVVEPITPALPDVVTVAPDFVPVNPYKGLDAFTAADRTNFFGRTALIATLVEAVEAATAERFLAIVGASGAGKSSVVMAGLLPALQDKHPDWVFLPRVVPGDRPLEALAVILEQFKRGAVSDYLKDMVEPNARGLVLQTKGLVRDPGQRVILFIDQFEELFTQTPREDDRRQFIDLITTAVTDPRSPLHVILTLRADFYDRPLAYAELTRLLNGHTEAIPPMHLADLREVVEEPAHRQHLTFESDLAADLVFAVQEQSGALPLLQFTLDQLFERRTGLTLTRTAYDAIGGLRGALAKHAEATYQDLPTDAHRRLARWVFLRLIEPGATEQDTTRRRVLRHDLTPDQPEDVAIVGAVIDDFITARLLTGGEGDSLEVAHEALLREWPTLVGWIGGARTDLPTQNALRTATADWLTAGANPEDDGRLARSGRLRDFHDWAIRNQPTSNERRYIDASTAWEVELARRDAQRKQELITAASRAKAARRVAGIVGAVAAVIVVLAAISFLLLQQSATAAKSAADQANTQVAVALTSTLAPIPVTIAALQDTLNKSYLGNAQAVMTDQPAYGAYLALHASNGRYQPTVDPFLMAGLGGITADNFAGNIHNVISVAFSPDGRYALTGSEDGPARLWDVTTGQTVRILSSLMGYVTSVTFSPDGRYVLTGNSDGTARLWDVATGQTVRILSGHTSSITSVVFSPDGRYVLTGSADRTARLWDMATGQTVRILSGHTDYVTSVAFSPDGRYALTGSDDHTAQLWDVATGQTVRILSRHTDYVYSVAFSPDGRYALTGSADYTARLWDVATGQTVRILSRHEYSVNNVAFSPDGHYALTGSRGGTARLWDVTSVQTVRLLSGHTDVVTSVAFSSDGRYALTGSGDRTARLWDVTSGQTVRILSGHTDSVLSVAFSRDGRYALTGSSDRTVRLWDVASGQTVRILSGYKSYIYSVAFSPDGRYALTGSADRTARLWDMASGQTVRILSDHTDVVTSVAFSPDGRYALTGSNDGTARLWDVATGQTVRILSGHTGFTSVAFSADGRYALTGSNDGTARLWDLATGQTIRILSGHTSYVYSVAFSADGRYALTGSDDGTARLWDLGTGQEIERYFGSLTPLLGGVSLEAGGKPPYSAFTSVLCGMLPPLLPTDIHDLNTVCPTLPAATGTPTLVAPQSTAFVLITTPTASPLNLPSPTFTPSAAELDNPTLTPSITLTVALQTSYTPLAIASPTASDTPTATATGTLFTSTFTSTPKPNWTDGPSPTVKPTITDTPGPSPTVIIASHFTPEPTASPTLSPTVQMIASSSATAIDSPTVSDTHTATVNATINTFTPTYDPQTTSPTPTPSASPTMTGTLPTATPSVTLSFNSSTTALPSLTDTPLNPPATFTLAPDLTPSPSLSPTYLGVATEIGLPKASNTPINTPTP